MFSIKANSVNVWLFPTALFLLGLTVWVIGMVLVSKQFLAIFNVASGVLAVVCILLLCERQYFTLAGIFLCITLLLAVSNIGLSLSWQKTQNSGPFMGLLGKEGVTATPLQPKGRVRIDGQMVDAMSEGLFVAEGEKIRVIRCGKKTLIVEKIVA
jgi:membrane-bound ClpP family serine protease